ncbi:MAG TPA: sigma-70 family RNA polymerase sigma factor [Nocardioidaceae bacterium]|nr:sigma-70 family RNA polymerase sigma factor [Nocardioidaceae bacterium]
MRPSSRPVFVGAANLDGLRHALAVATMSGGKSPTGPTLAPDRGDVDPPSDASENRRIVALVDLARGGDAEAFGQLYDHYVESIHRYLYFRLSSVSLADDLTSETFFRALRSIQSFRWQGKDFGAWLTTIARNLVTDHYKSSRSRFEVVADELPEQVEESDGPEDGALATLTSEVLARGLRRLASEQQDCLVMRFCQGLTIAETATAMGRSEGAIKQLQLRAVRNLAKHLPRDLI